MLDQPVPILIGIQDLRKDVGLLDFDESCAEEFGNEGLAEATRRTS